MATIEEELFLQRLKKRFGSNAIEIVVDILTTYQITSLKPLHLIRARKPISFYADKIERKQAQKVIVNPNTVKFFYIKSAATCIKDRGELSANRTIKYDAYRSFFEYCKSAGEAFTRGVYTLLTYQPSEIAKFADKHPDLFQFSSDTNLHKRSSRLIVRDPTFRWESFEEAQEFIEDPFEYSVDDEPILPKPIAELAPSPLISVQDVENDVDWDQIAKTEEEINGSI